MHTFFNSSTDIFIIKMTILIIYHLFLVTLLNIFRLIIKIKFSIRKILIIKNYVIYNFIIYVLYLDL